MGIFDSKEEKAADAAAVKNLSNSEQEVTRLQTELNIRCAEIERLHGELNDSQAALKQQSAERSNRATVVPLDKEELRRRVAEMPVPANYTAQYQNGFVAAKAEVLKLLE